MFDARSDSKNLARQYEAMDVVAMVIVLGVAAFSSFSIYRDLCWFVAAVCGIFLGAKSFFGGIRDWKFRRKTQDIPTCKINTGAVGTDVEVKGYAIAEKEKRVKAPITGKDCVLYHLEIQMYIPGGRHSAGSWDTLDSFYSDKGFFLDDDSGAYADVSVSILVDGKPRFQQTGVRRGILHGPIRLNVARTKRIELIVDFGKNGDIQDRFNWVEAALIR